MNYFIFAIFNNKFAQHFSYALLAHGCFELAKKAFSQDSEVEAKQNRLSL